MSSASLPLLHNVVGRARVVLVNPPAPQPVLRDNYCGFQAKASYLWPPIDLLVQSGWLAEDFTLSVVDAIADDLNPPRALARVLAAEPDVMLMLSSGATFLDDAAFARQVHEARPDALLIASMSHLVQPALDYLERFPWMNGVLNDYTSPDLRHALLGLDHGPDLVRRGDIPRDAKAKPRPLGYPMPRHELFPLDSYSMPLGWKGQFSTVLSGYGCAHSCSFCTGSAIRYRRRPKEDVLAELELLRSRGIHNVFFVDYTFTSSRRYVLELCQEMARMRPRFRWTGFGRVEQLDDEMIRALKASGCDLLQIGVESADDAVLARYKKGFTVSQVRTAFARCRRLGLRTLGFFIIGLPGESRQSIKDTIQLAMELDPDLASFSVPTPDPGTSLLDEAHERGVLGSEPSQVLSTVGPTLPAEGLTEKEVRGLREEAIRRFYLRPSFLLRQVRSLRSFEDLKDRALNAVELLRKAH